LGGHLDVVEWLVATGADVNCTPGFDGVTPLYVAVQEEYLAGGLLRTSSRPALNRRNRVRTSV
jgi:hypothetical protein